MAGEGLRQGNGSSTPRHGAKTLVSKLLFTHRNLQSRVLNRRQLDYEGLFARLLHIIDMMRNMDIIRRILKGKWLHLILQPNKWPIGLGVE